MTDRELPPVIPLPAPLDRRSRVGPFPHARAAFRFLSIVAGGAAIASVLGPAAWVPFLGGGFLLTVSRGDAKTIDERLGDFVRWRIRRRSGGDRTPPARGWPRTARYGRLDGGRLVAAISAQGVPVAFLPPLDARTLFDGYRELLRSDDGGFLLRVTSEPIASHPFRLAAPPTPGEGPAAARAGYDEMVRLLLRRRRRRSTLVVLWSPSSSLSDRTTLDARSENFLSRLRALGVVADRLEGRALGRALGRFGWSIQGSG